MVRYKISDYVKRGDIVDKVLVVDDDKSIVNMVSEFMKLYGLEAVTAYSGETAINKLDNSISLILLDINMNELSGIDLCKIFRERTNVPIVFLTANSSQYDMVLGLGIGADDYITKPFDPVELIARVKAHIRRYKQYGNVSSNNDNEIIEVGEIKIFKDSHKVLKGDSEVNLTVTEYNLLMYFIENDGKVLTRKQILNNVWKSDMYDENTVTTYTKRLRKKIEEDAKSPRFIKSVRSIGYIFNGQESATHMASGK
ncbi:MAG: response regulator transcription factor [Clostridium lundense]|nr:response regulator transcription factor [Clostridium lundense]